MEKAVRGRELLHKWILYGLLMFVTLFVVTQNAEAAVTGKIAGVVVDANTGEPLIGANVIIEGTDRGAACDADGYYYIIRLDPGVYNVQARMMGYGTITKTGVRVESGHTTPLNFELGTAVVRGTGVVVQAEREVIKMDLSSSSTVAGKEDIEAVPLVSDVAQYLNLQAGIDGWSVRGGGLEDTRLMADGLLLVDNRVNEPILMPNLSEVKEVSLVRGGFNAEFSNVRAGLVQVITKDGSPDRYGGSFECRYTPGYQKHSGRSIYDIDNYYNRIYFWNKLDTGYLNPLYASDSSITGYLDTIIKLDSVCWKGVEDVWEDEESPFYDTLKLKDCSAPSWDGWIAQARNNPTTPEMLQDRFRWRHLIDDPRTDSLFDIYSNGLAYIPVYGTDEDGDTVITGFTREPYTIPEDQPRRGEYGDLPDWTIDGGFGGPVPVLGQYLGDMTFFASYRLSNETFPLPDSRDYYKESSTSLKLTSRLGNMKMSLKGAYSIVNTLAPWATGERVGTDADIGQGYLRGPSDMVQYPGEWDGIFHGSDKVRSTPVNLFNPIALTPFDVKSRMYGFSMQHALSENTFYDVKLTYVFSKNKAHYWYDIPLRMKDTTLIWFGYPLDTIVDSLGRDSIFYNTDPNYMADYAADNIPYGFAHPDNEIERLLGVDLVGYGSAQTLGTFNVSWSQTYNARVDLTSQINKYNQIKTGFDFNYDKIYEVYMINSGYSWPDPGYELVDTGGQYFVNYDAFPILAGGYVQDKIEFEGMFANVGLRFDYADPNTRWPSRDSTYIYSPYYSAHLKEELFEQDSMLVDVPAVLKVSPRVGISFPILEKSKLFFNYGHFYSLAPNKRRFLISWGREGEPIEFIGNPALDMERTISYEVGFESSIADQFLARVTGYYRDNDNEYAQVYYEDIDRAVYYYTYENLEYSDVRGFELELRKPAGRFFTGWVIYDYRVTATGQSGRERHYQNVILNAQEGMFDPEEVEPIPQPVWRAQATFKTPNDWGIFLGGYSFSLMYSWRAGRYQDFNPFINPDPDILDLLTNNLQHEHERMLDLSLNKNFSIAGTKVTFFMDVHNVFNWDELSTFAFRGDFNDYVESLHLEMFKDYPYTNHPRLTPPAEGEEPDHFGDLKSDDKPYINNPAREFLWYMDPRYVQFGLRFSF